MIQATYAVMIQATYAVMIQATYAVMIQATYAVMIQATYAVMIQATYSSKTLIPPTRLHGVTTQMPTIKLALLFYYNRNVQ